MSQCFAFNESAYYYATLGVARDASADEIKRAYRKLARKYHPDVSNEPDGEARFKEAAEACQCNVELLVTLVREGVLEPSGTDPAAWRFRRPTLQRARVAIRLTPDREMNRALSRWRST